MEKGEKPGGRVTVWDQAFLKSLYSTDRTSRLQESQIARVMVHNIVH